MRLPDDIRALLRSQDATRPRLTWYGESAGERVELSGRVLDNWAAKAGNLLQDEYDVQPGSVVRLDLPSGHWRAMYWALGSWSLGATVEVAGDASSASGEACGTSGASGASGVDVLVSSRSPESIGLARAGVPVIAVTLAALARRSAWPLPAGDIDEAQQLASYGDVLDPLEGARPTDPALRGHDGNWTFEALLAPVAWGARLVLPATAPGEAMLRAAVSAWAADGSVVITPPWPEAELRRVAGIEGGEIAAATSPPGTA